MTTTPHIVFAGGGALGNLYPGLAIAEILAQQLPDVRITFLGDGRPIERDTVTGWGWRYMAAPGMRTPLGPLRATADMTIGKWVARWMLSEHQVSLVVGLGGPATRPALAAAQSRGLPNILLETNAEPPAAHCRLAKRANLTCVAFEEARSRLPIDAALAITGAPGRGGFERIYSRRAAPRLAQTGFSRPREKRLVVIGGVGGATSLNDHTPSALACLGKELDGWRVIHQSGAGRLRETENRYQRAGVDALVVTYLDEMAAVCEEADLVVCRAGGATLAELALAGLPAVLVPDGRPSGGSQLRNAQIYQREGACRVIDEAALKNPQTADRSARDLSVALARELRPLLVDDAQRSSLAGGMLAMARPGAAAQIAAACGELIETAAPTRGLAVAAPRPQAA
ncbi:UDP-N-acetylglucosamine--N-acetylmuramyl-(pentapeptide) pyrophosphoryl-undecaprenol N-acetylglucosamine transferase MurG [Pseudobythopirellula maris]|uniref:UDP-N-acetylglucosamine--N-acetylmuramyl-(pentapeptide) pyrophosphoryl-undecaprenol N-acetylglucosamine transferase n=1 Tax=Pseudobythopirellula maris TaxID=2527991 RepID=A0A5C5ZTA0_9BACT|nr:UDP-N-acetylglucosamine--N-acetylmuramyl-(pentapeptide) pyrophosphoryl-undecaprenol N-acetylglucosamine transferase [Pseudobythopirellula maris]TWT90051.1 UDP-N-acetylglucosamine--N-acetylmuramyl-(pentapeptide) pyrophosphoryl-undecaprenol N-acetylglucosamine transferase MurG [Pseudobythopirellula maris]